VTTELTDQQRIARLALLAVRRIDMPHPTLPGARVIGYVVEADEHYEDGEGLAMIQALEDVADFDPHQVREDLLMFIEEDPQPAQKAAGSKSGG
jgi:hypothetical protein